MREEEGGEGIQMLPIGRKEKGRIEEEEGRKKEGERGGTTLIIGIEGMEGEGRERGEVYSNVSYTIGG